MTKNAENNTTAEHLQAYPAIHKIISNTDAWPKRDYADRNERAEALKNITGHPLSTLERENTALTERISATPNRELPEELLEIAVHYAKKGDLLYPLLKVKYGVTGPADVMWTDDDRIRDELSSLAKEIHPDEGWSSRLVSVLKDVRTMITKEQKILFPICAANFTPDEWYGIYRDSADYNTCFGVEPEVWEEAEHSLRPVGSAVNDEIVMPGGHLTTAQITALLNTIPMEITFVDADDINCFFNEGPKIFKRPSMAIDRDVFSCHPPKIEPMVRSIIEDFRNNRRDSVPIWMEKNGHAMLVTYMAVRSKNGTYLGTVELVQNMDFAKEHFCSE